jgi:hypothetical protein
MTFKTLWRFQVYAPPKRSGRRELVYDKEETGNSVVGNIISFLYLKIFQQMANPPYASGCSFYDITNTLVTLATNNNHTSESDATGGQTDRGVVLGTGTDPVTVDDYKLQTLIAHGSGAGALLYGVQTNVVPVVGGSPRFMQMVRAFSNGAAGSVVVSEAGFYLRLAANPYTVLIERSLVTPFNIPPLGSATATSTLGVAI